MAQDLQIDTKSDQRGIEQGSTRIGNKGYSQRLRREAQTGIAHL